MKRDGAVLGHRVDHLRSGEDRRQDFVPSRAEDKKGQLMKPENSERFAWLGSAAGLFAVVACYGTLAAVALLAAIGTSVDLNEGALVIFITVLLGLAIAGTVYSFRLHRHPGPLALSLLSVAVLLWVFYGSYSKPFELLGFAGLVAASIWDFRCKKKACPAPKPQDEH